MSSSHDFLELSTLLSFPTSVKHKFPLHSSCWLSVMVESEAELPCCFGLNLNESLRVGGVGGVVTVSVLDGCGEWLVRNSILEGVSGLLKVSASKMDFLCFGDL